MRRVLFILILAAALSGFFVASAQAASIVGGDTHQRDAVKAVLDSQPALVAYVESVWPDFEVRINFGGHAWPGRMDVCKRYSGMEFAALVSHELGHMVQLAADAEGDYPAIGSDWLQLLRDRGRADDIWVWDETAAPYYGRMNPWEAFAENVARAYYSTYTGRSTPNTCLVWLSRAEMTEFLRAHGVEI